MWPKVLAIVVSDETKYNIIIFIIFKNIFFFFQKHNKIVTLTLNKTRGKNSLHGEPKGPRSYLTPPN
jgi:hypothetical protein